MVQFYINYEECKYFIWKAYGIRLGQFYINYEECKFRISTYSCTIEVSFILTMRNVNTLSNMSLVSHPAVLY